jgi:hypothetical protein
MILTTHAITGAALASLTPNEPLVGFSVGFLSHFLLDTIPHWDYYYTFASLKKDKNNPMNDDMLINKDFVKDILKVGLDATVGLLLAYLIFGFYMKYSILIISCGAIGAMMPDGLTFIHMKWRHEPLTSLQRFHNWVHSKIILNDKPVIGILSQIILICIVVWWAKI